MRMRVNGLVTAEEPADGRPHESVDSAQLYAKYRRVAAEQAALRRLAALVAPGIEPTEVFRAVADEMRDVCPGTPADCGAAKRSVRLSSSPPLPIPQRGQDGRSAPDSAGRRHPRNVRATHRAPRTDRQLRRRRRADRCSRARGWRARGGGVPIIVDERAWAWRRSVPCGPALCRPTPRSASAASPN